MLVLVAHVVVHVVQLLLRLLQLLLRLLLLCVRGAHNAGAYAPATMFLYMSVCIVSWTKWLRMVNTSLHALAFFADGIGLYNACMAWLSQRLAHETQILPSRL